MNPPRSDAVSARSRPGWRVPHFDYPLVAGALYTAADLAAVGLAAVVASFIIGGDLSMTLPQKLVAVISLFLTRIWFSQIGLYHSWRGRSLIEHVGALTLAWTAVIMSVVLFAFFLDEAGHVNRDWIGVWFLIGWVLICTARSAATLGLREVRKRGWNHKRVLVVGNDSWKNTVVRRLNNAIDYGLDVVAVLSASQDEWGTDLDGVPVVGGPEVIPSVLAEEQIDEVWICAGSEADSQLDGSVDKVLRLLRHNTVTQRIIPCVESAPWMQKPVVDILGLPVVNVSVSPMRNVVNRAIKAVEDRVVAALILLIASPVMLATALAIKLTSRGPVLFKQMRHGWDGQPIEIYKFRTMVVHDEESGQVTQARKGDPRVTPLGNFLRRTSLDELPQFINALQGRMSIVGPRPHAIEHNQFYMHKIDAYMQRHKVKPGITGWAQINGLRGETGTVEKMRKRVEYDFYYIDNWSVWFDLRIILLTVVRGFFHPNAY